LKQQREIKMTAKSYSARPRGITWRLPLYLVLLLGSTSIFTVDANKQKHDRHISPQEDEQEEAPLHVDDILSASAIFSDEFGLPDDQYLDGFGRTKEAPSRLRKSKNGHPVHKLADDNTQRRNLLSQKWEDVMASFYDSTLHTDGMQTREVSGAGYGERTRQFGSRASMQGVNQRVHHQSLSAMFAAEELQGILDMSMSMPVSIALVSMHQQTISHVDTNILLFHSCSRPHSFLQ
jgi:hypothetical protein